MESVACIRGVAPPPFFFLFFSFHSSRDIIREHLIHRTIPHGSKVLLYQRNANPENYVYAFFNRLLLNVEAIQITSCMCLYLGSMTNADIGECGFKYRTYPVSHLVAFESWVELHGKLPMNDSILGRSYALNLTNHLSKSGNFGRCSVSIQPFRASKRELLLYLYEITLDFQNSYGVRIARFEVLLSIYIHTYHKSYLLCSRSTIFSVPTFCIR